MKTPSLSFVSGVVLAAAVIASLLVAPAAAKKPSKPAPQPPPPSTSNLYVKNYVGVVDGVKCSVTPQAVAATSDGGSVLLALSSRPSDLASDSCRGVNWIVKLDAFGNPQWQKSVGCFHLPPGSYSYGVSLQQTADGGYFLAGTSNLKLTDGAPLVPWLAKTDAAGNLLWQHFYYHPHPTTTRPLGQYFASSDPATDGGFVALGFDVREELFAVKTDSDGLVGGCSQIHPATPLEALDPGLATIAPALPVHTTAAVQAASPSTTQPTSISSTTGDGC